jgi:hypothetical protein
MPSTNFTMNHDPMWQFSFPIGAFVREKRDHKRWGQIVAPSESPGRWIVQYAHGGRIEPAGDQIETFQPNAAEVARIRAVTAMYKDRVEEEKRANPHAGL